MQSMEIVQTGNFQSEMEVVRPDRCFAGGVLQNNVETIALEQTVLAGGDDFAAQVFSKRQRSRLRR